MKKCPVATFPSILTKQEQQKSIINIYKAQILVASHITISDEITPATPAMKICNQR